MGSFQHSETQRRGGRPLGKIDASLNEKLSRVKWGEYKLGDLFYVKTTKSIDKNKITFSRDGDYDFIGRSNIDNGVQGKVNYLGYVPNAKDTFSLVQVGETICLFRNNEWYASQNIFILSPKITYLSRQFLFTTATINKALYEYRSAYVYPTLEEVKRIKVVFPQTGNGEIDFDFMENFVVELEARRVAELEAYLLATGLKDYGLTEEERNALDNYKTLKWFTYNLEELFGKSTRGKRLKGDDRIAGTLPFVTAGEACEGISAFIGNKVEIFESNTTTIDMFGSAKYRNYRYGADDHVAVVHTEKIAYKAAIFTTSAIHKAAHTGKFDYGHNFYAKDADALDIILPERDGLPDYKYMETLISAIQKLVIKDVVLYADSKIAETKNILQKR